MFQVGKKLVPLVGKKNYSTLITDFHSIIKNHAFTTPPVETKELSPLRIISVLGSPWDLLGEDPLTYTNQISHYESVAKNPVLGLRCTRIRKDGIEFLHYNTLTPETNLVNAISVRCQGKWKWSKALNQNVNGIAQGSWTTSVFVEYDWDAPHVLLFSRKIPRHLATRLESAAHKVPVIWTTNEPAFAQAERINQRITKILVEKYSNYRE